MVNLFHYSIRDSKQLKNDTKPKQWKLWPLKIKDYRFEHFIKNQNEILFTKTNEFVVTNNIKHQTKYNTSSIWWRFERRCCLLYKERKEDFLFNWYQNLNSTNQTSVFFIRTNRNKNTMMMMMMMMMMMIVQKIRTC